jgi:hypothetical protein
MDFLTVLPGQAVTLLEHDGPGCINHTYAALAYPEITDYRDAIIRCYWDGADTPSVEVPFGDFFGLAHGRIRLMSSAMTAVNPGLGASHGLHNYFPMPFATGARVTLEHRGDRPLGGMFPALWYHIDYDAYDAPPSDDILRFHAQFRQEKPTVAVGDEPNKQLHNARNLDGAENYVALEATGRGQMAGLLLQVNNIAGGWWGEGDDMVFIDDEPWPPAMHGTGTEEIFGGGACPTREYSTPYHGFHLIESPDFSGLTGAYRWFVNDPIRFTTSIRWTLEHGHANNFANEYTSVAFWYQDAPHAAFPSLPERDAMHPPLPPIYEEARTAFFAAAREALRFLPDDPRTLKMSQISELYYAGHFASALERLRGD